MIILIVGFFISDIMYQMSRMKESMCWGHVWSSEVENFGIWVLKIPVTSQRVTVKSSRLWRFAARRFILITAGIQLRS